VSTSIGASDAARLLGVSKSTLYAYVSRGIVTRRTAVDGRTSLYSRDEIDHLRQRSRQRPVSERPSIDVQITSSITELHDDGVRYRGHDVAGLATTTSFERTAELLWTNRLPEDEPRWPVDKELLAICKRAVDAVGSDDPLTALTLTATVLAAHSPTLDAAAAARHMLAIVPSVLGGSLRGDTATRLTGCWIKNPSPEFVAAVTQALVLLADHELATSTLAVRVACSVRTDPYSAFAVGLSVMRGALHGAASRDVTALFDEAAEVGASAAVNAYLRRRDRLPGFGHSVYRNGDPRFAPLLECVSRIPVTNDRIEIVDDVLGAAGRQLGLHPNVDFALGALTFVAEIPPDVPLFAIARIAGWAAHYAEELDERPVRFRGLSRTR
jgi:citrate synthase